MRFFPIIGVIVLCGCGGGGGNDPGQTGSMKSNPPVTCKILEILVDERCYSVLDEPSEPRGPNTTTQRPLLTAGSPILSTVTLDWIPPSESWEGLAPPFLAGYVIYLSEPVSGYYQVVEQVRLDNPGLLTYVLDLPGPGRWGVSVTAISTSGNESAHSNLEEIISD